MNCFELHGEILKGNRFRDFVQVHLYACNYIGFTLSIMGYGIKASIRIYDPSKRSSSDSNES